MLRVFHSCARAAEPCYIPSSSIIIDLVRVGQCAKNFWNAKNPGVFGGSRRGENAHSRAGNPRAEVTEAQASKIAVWCTLYRGPQIAATTLL